MKGLRQAGSVGAFLLGLAFILTVLGDVVIGPALGINSAADGINPAKVLPQAAVLRLVFAVPILFAPGIVLAALALYERLKPQAPSRMRVATASGLIAATLFLIAGMVSFVGLAEFADLYSTNPSTITTGSMAATDGIVTGVLMAGIFASGWWALLSSWAALQGGLPKILAYLGLLFGALGILAFVVPPFSAIGAIVGVIWAAWLGIALMSEPATIAAAGSASPHAMS
jgi:hypothetical protein